MNKNAVKKQKFSASEKTKILKDKNKTKSKDVLFIRLTSKIIIIKKKAESKRMEKATLIKYKLKAGIVLTGSIGNNITILLPAKTDFKGYILMM